MPSTDYTKPDRPTMDLLRFATAGSVDDGKSTLIGRLLFDSKQVLTDQLEHVEEASRRRGGDGDVDLAVAGDGDRRLCGVVTLDQVRRALAAAAPGRLA